MVVSEVRYSAFGEMRYLDGETVTDLLYTGQKLEEELGLYYYVARWYDPYLNRFLSPDSIIPDPGNSTAYDRYAYVENNPINYTNLTGHYRDDGCQTEGCSGDPDAVIHTIYMGGYASTANPYAKNFSEIAEESYVSPSQQPGNPLADLMKSKNRPDDSAIGSLADVVDLTNTVLTHGLVYKSYHDPKEIHSYLNYKENPDGSLELMSIEIWNQTSQKVNLNSVFIKAESSGNVLPINQYYSVKKEGISAPNYSGLGYVDSHSFGEINLSPSLNANQSHIFFPETSIWVTGSLSYFHSEYGLTQFIGTINVFIKCNE